MTKWLQSGLRRDVCVAVAGLEHPTGQDVKREVEAKYGSSVRPKTFRGALAELVSNGYLEEEPDGVHDRYALTPTGRERLEEQVAWMRDRVEDG